MAIYMNQPVSVRKLVRRLTNRIVSLHASHFVFDSWAGVNKFGTNKLYHPRAIKGGKSGVGTSSSCITSSFLVSYAAVFVLIFTQLDDTKKAAEVNTSSLLYLSSWPLQIVSHFQTKPNPCMEFRKKIMKCIIWGAFNPDNINRQRFVH